jgi:hypothetical protein
MSKKNIIAIVAGIIIITLAVGIFKYVEKKKELERREIQISKFQSRYDEINDITPYENNEYLMEDIKNSNLNTNDQVEAYIIKSKIDMLEKGTFFKMAYEHNLNLTIDMVKYKLGSKKNIENIEDIKSIVDDIRYNKKDKLNLLIIKTFDTSLKYYQIYVEYSTSSLY